MTRPLDSEPLTPRQHTSQPPRRVLPDPTPGRLTLAQAQGTTGVLSIRLQELAMAVDDRLKPVLHEPETAAASILSDLAGHPPAIAAVVGVNETLAQVVEHLSDMLDRIAL